MQYNYREKVKLKKRSHKARFIILPILGVIAGLYILFITLSPMLVNTPGASASIQRELQAAPDMNEDRVYIPKINVNVPFFDGNKTVLERGAWHRYPERGNPEKGGNFILSAHRFSIGWTPQQTRKQSPFYNVGNLAVGDQILVDFKGERYGYEISEKRTVKPNETEIEDATKQAKLTLYSCTLSGSTDGRDVFFAKPLGKVKDLNFQ